jgi:hypothetical protein
VLEESGGRTHDRSLRLGVGFVRCSVR